MMRTISPAEVHAQAGRILGSPAFQKSKRLARFLSFAVENTLSGNADVLKESVLGLEVFDRGPDFDPGVDPIVRVDARRLRARLAEYYRAAGSGDSLLIEMEPGSYVPRFRRTEIRNDDRAGPHLVHTPKPIRNILALNLLRRARKEVEDTPTAEEAVKAFRLFQRAVEVNPDHALAQIGVAITSFWMQMLGCESPSSALARAKAAALRAIELDASSPEGLAVLGMIHSVYDHDFRAANGVFLRGARLNPDSTAIQQARAMTYLAPMGHLAEAAEIITMVLKKDSRSRFRFGLGWIRYLQGDWQSSAKELQKILEVNRHFLLARFLLVFAYERLGQHDAAAGIFNEAEMRTAYPLMAVRCEALGRLRAGKKDEAAAVARRMESEYASGSHEPMLAADVFAALGDATRAFEWLDRAVEDARFWLIYLKSDPAFDAIRGDARFEELLTRIGLGTTSAPSTSAV